METITAIPLPESIAGIVGIFMPIAIQFIKSKVDSKQLRWGITLVLCGAVGTIGAVIAGEEVSVTNIAKLTTIAFGMSQIVYNSVKSLLA